MHLARAPEDPLSYQRSSVYPFQPHSKTSHDLRDMRTVCAVRMYVCMEFTSTGAKVGSRQCPTGYPLISNLMLSFPLALPKILDPSLIQITNFFAISCSHFLAHPNPKKKQGV